MNLIGGGTGTDRSVSLLMQARTARVIFPFMGIWSCGEMKRRRLRI